LGHAAALYTVHVKEPRGDHQPLGDIDGAGTYLLDVLADYVANLGEISDEDGERILRCLDSRSNGDELIMTMQLGQSGVVADIVDADQNPRLRQIWTDTALIRCGGLFKLPRQQVMGWLALHVNNGRGIKGLLDRAVPPRFRTEFDRILELRPFIRGSALREAIEADKLAKVRLLRYERPADRANASTNRWVPADQYGKIELDISARGRGQMLKTAVLQRFLAGDGGAHDEIFEFAGMTFEQVKVEVDVDGRRRTFNLQNPTAGHPMTIDIQPDFDDEGEPREESLIGALREALGAVTN
jgi:hypothetical protein